MRNSAYSFKRALAAYDKSNIHLIGSGSYAYVFRSPPQKIIFKLIRVMPDYVLEQIQTSSLNRTTKYMDALNEFQISASLCRLQNGVLHRNALYSCNAFPFVHQSFLTYDELPGFFKTGQPEDECDQTLLLVSAPEIFDNFLLDLPRENMVIVMEDCGEPMVDTLDGLHPHALLSIIKQIIMGLMIAEVTMEFEHRDMHSGNVLLQPFDHKYVRYVVRGKKMCIPSFGYRVKIIDTTFSRLRISMC